MYRVNVATRRWRHLTGSGVSRPTQVAIAAGAQYSWESAAVAPGTSLLSRTAFNADTAQGYSGSEKERKMKKLCGLKPDSYYRQKSGKPQFKWGMRA